MCPLRDLEPHQSDDADEVQVLLMQGWKRLLGARLALGL